MSRIAVIEWQYLPPVQFFTLFLRYDRVLLEKHEHYHKGSYRNRTYIAGANGPLRLTIPLRKGKNEQQPVDGVQIAYDQPWQQQHWQSIQSAYGNSPFFPYYADDLAPLFTEAEELLVQWNQKLLTTVIDCLGLDSNLAETQSWEDPLPEGFDDWRNAIHPKPHRGRKDPRWQPQVYPQVFREKHGFLPNLSILDLLFCAGPESVSILEGSLSD